MEHTTVRGKVHCDNTGAVNEIPIILTEYGPLRPLVEYMLARAHVRSQASMAKLVQGVGLLLDYMSANHDCFESTQQLFESFTQRLYTGTVGDDGKDPSGLYWNGRSPSLVRQLVTSVSEFSDWMADRQRTKPLNPWRQSTRGEEMLAWAAWHHRRDRAFLAHTWNRDKASLAISRSRNTLLRRTPILDHDHVKSFPERRIQDLLFKGFIVPGKQSSPRLEERLNLRDILITLLMHYGGLRMSETFHLFVHDVSPDPYDHELAQVRVFHPSLGVAPADWSDGRGKQARCNRQTYLRGKHAMRPRTEYALSDQLHAGWKGNTLDAARYSMDVFWFPRWAGTLFMKLWVLYMAQRAQMDCNHPFAFVTESGGPYSIDSFERMHRRAVERIGLTPAKALGTTPHAHRHSYGQLLTDAGIDPIFRKKALHHRSLESQVVYTEPDRMKLFQILEDATSRIGTLATPPDFATYGFKDVDPLGLMSGPNPRLKRKA